MSFVMAFAHSKSKMPAKIFMRLYYTIDKRFRPMILKIDLFDVIGLQYYTSRLPTPISRPTLIDLTPDATSTLATLI